VITAVPAILDDATRLADSSILKGAFQCLVQAIFFVT